MQTAELDDDELLLGTPAAPVAPIPVVAAKRDRSPPKQAADTTTISATTTPAASGAAAAGVFSFQGGNGLSKMSALAFGKPKPSSILNNKGDEAQRRSKQPRVCLETVLANAKKNAAVPESASPLRTAPTTQQSPSTTPTSMVKPSPQQHQQSSSSVTPAPSSATPTCGGSTVMGTNGGGGVASTPQPTDSHSTHPVKNIVARNVLLDDEDEETPVKSPTPMAVLPSSQQSAPSPVVTKPATPAAVPTPALKKSTSTTTMLKKSTSASSSSAPGPKQQSLAAFFKPKQ